MYAIIYDTFIDANHRYSIACAEDIDNSGDLYIYRVWHHMYEDAKFKRYASSVSANEKTFIKRSKTPREAAQFLLAHYKCKRISKFQCMKWQFENHWRLCYKVEDAVLA